MCAKLKRKKRKKQHTFVTCKNKLILRGTFYCLWNKCWLVFAYVCLFYKQNTKIVIKYRNQNVRTDKIYRFGRPLIFRLFLSQKNEHKQNSYINNNNNNNNLHVKLYHITNNESLFIATKQKKIMLLHVKWVIFHYFYYYYYFLPFFKQQTAFEPRECKIK